MSQRKVTRLGLDPELTARLVHNQVLTAQDIMQCPILTLMDISDLSYAAAVSLMATVGTKLVQPYTVLEALQSNDSQLLVRFLPIGTVGCFAHDVVGGILVGTINEVCGPPGSGKSQLCLGCCADIVMQHWIKQYNNDYNSCQKSTAARVVYYDTELKFSRDRLIEIILARHPWAKKRQSDGADTIADVASRNVFVRRPLNCAEFVADLSNLDSFIVAEGITLIVVDSIAALPRNEGINRKEEENFALHQASILQSLAETCSCAVLVTNQIITPSVTDSKDIMLGDIFRTSAGAALKPALGIEWHHRISTRYVLCNATGPNSLSDLACEGTDDKHDHRVLSVEKSPISGIVKYKYEITASGLHCISQL